MARLEFYSLEALAEDIAASYQREEPGQPDEDECYEITQNYLESMGAAWDPVDGEVEDE